VFQKKGKKRSAEGKGGGEKSAEKFEID